MRTSVPICVLAATTLAFPAAAQSAIWTFTGSVGDEYGAAVIKTGDQNNDGWPDVLVGAPGWNGDRGYVRALSGRFLATGQGSTTLWTLFSTANAGARFGSSLAEVATLTGNSATDYMVGAPGYVGATACGALMLVDGSTHTIASTITGEAGTKLGGVIVAVGDQDGDGKIEVASSAIPVSATNNNGKVHVVSGAAFTAGSHSLTSVVHWTRNGGWHDFGAALASGFDLDHDGKFDLAIGLPTYGFNNPEAGYFEVLRPDSSMQILGAYVPPITGEHFGASVDAKYDVNGDGFVDFIVGAPGFDGGAGNEVGRALVVSGARLLNPNSGPSLDLFDIRFPSIQTTHFGQSVRAVADLNHDGVADFLVGMPNYFTIFPPGSNKGGAQIFSGKTGERMGSLVGQSHDNLGDSLLELSMDINNDGYDDFAVAGSLSDNSNTDCGALKFYSLFPSLWSPYCTAKINSQGCGPYMTATGTASASSSTPFTVQCFNVLNQVSGLMIYGHQPVAAPFQGGYLCVNTPLSRTLVQSSGGTTGGPDCSGTFAYDFNALVHSGVDPTLIAGAEMFFQYWSRDPASPSTTNLSNGLRMLINP